MIGVGWNPFCEGGNKAVKPNERTNMTQIKTLEGLEGKIIKKVANDECLLWILLESEEYAVFEGDDYYNSVVETDYSLELTQSNFETLKKLGIVTQKDIEQYFEKIKNKADFEEKERKRAVYEQLKLEFGD